MSRHSCSGNVTIWNFSCKHNLWDYAIFTIFHLTTRIYPTCLSVPVHMWTVLWWYTTVYYWKRFYCYKTFLSKNIQTPQNKSCLGHHLSWLYKYRYFFVGSHPQWDNHVCSYSCKSGKTINTVPEQHLNAYPVFNAALTEFLLNISFSMCLLECIFQLINNFLTLVFMVLNSGLNQVKFLCHFINFVEITFLCQKRYLEIVSTTFSTLS